MAKTPPNLSMAPVGRRDLAPHPHATPGTEAAGADRVLMTAD